jgi:hypothetical protein
MDEFMVPVGLFFFAVGKYLAGVDEPVLFLLLIKRKTLKMNYWSRH